MSPQAVRTCSGLQATALSGQDPGLRQAPSTSSHSYDRVRGSVNGDHIIRDTRMTVHRILLLMLSLGLASAAVVAAEKSGQALTPLADRPPTPELDLLDMDGVRHRMSDYRGRVVIVNFWATWCPPCRDEMPSMQRAYEQLREEGIEMLAVNIGEDEDTIFAFTAGYPVEFPLLLDLDSATIQSWPVKGLPTTFVVDPLGRLAYRAIGGREWDDPDLLATVRALKN